VSVYEIYNRVPKGLPDSVQSWKLKDSGDGFFFTTYDTDNSDNIVEFYFKSTLAYLCIDESNRLELWANHKIDKDKIIYIVSESSFLRDFHRKSKCVHEGVEIFHFFIVTAGDCIDVLSTSHPEIIQRVR